MAVNLHILRASLKIERLQEVLEPIAACLLLVSGVFGHLRFRLAGVLVPPIQNTYTHTLGQYITRPLYFVPNNPRYPQSSVVPIASLVVKPVLDLTQP